MKKLTDNNLVKIFKIALLVILAVCQAAFAEKYEVYIFNKAFHGKTVFKDGKMWVGLKPLIETMNLKGVKLGESGEVFLNGKSFSDSFLKDGEIYVKLDSFTVATGNKIIFNEDTKIVDVLHGSSTLSPEEIELLREKIKAIPLPDTPKSFELPSSPVRENKPAERVIPPGCSNPEASEFYSQAINDKNGGHYAEAIEKFTKAILLDSGWASPPYERGKVYLSLKEFGKAIDDFSRSAILNPGFPNIYYNRGLAYAGLSDDGMAIEDFNTALSMDPHLPHVFFQRALVEEHLGDHSRAVEDCKAAVSLDSKYADGCKGIASGK